MVIFDGVLQPETPLVHVDNVWFFVVFNNTHFNNSLAYHAYLTTFTQSLPPCRCGSPECSSYLLISDRFAGHNSEDIKTLLQQRHIKPVVVEDTRMIFASPI